MQMTAADLIGHRTMLTPLELRHIDQLYEAASDPAVWTYMPMRVQTADDMLALVADALAARQSGHEFPFVIIDQQTGKVVGSTRFLDISPANRSLEIGWTWLAPAAWRTSINTEAKYLLLRHCFESLRTIRVQFKTDSRNTRSQQAIERIGGVREGVLRRHRILQNGYIRDSVYYSIIDQEWPTVKTALEQRLEPRQ
ncbi:MAG: GNAT family N-acetyltransferase [Bacilli bacterium]